MLLVNGPDHKYWKVVLFAIFSLLSGCIAKNDIVVNLRNPKKATTAIANLNATVSNVQIVNHQIIITGTNLNGVSNFNINENGNTTNLQIESKTSTSIVANTISNVTFAAGKVFDFILSNASAASSFTVNFSLCDSTLGGKGFNCSITPNDKEVLSYDAVSGKWKPRAVNGLSYQGKWDATTALPAIGALTAGDYFIVSVANAPYSVGDWIVLNNTFAFDRIGNSIAITNVFGRTGTITASKGDYVLAKMGDVDLTTTPPIAGDILKYDGTNWVPGTVSAGGGGTVTTVSGTAPISVATGTSTPVVSIAQATGVANGYLSSADWNTFNTKQAVISAGTTTQYYRGDKTFQTLDTSAVSENTNLYFTNARALGVPLSGFNSALAGQIAATDTILQAFGRTQNQINSLTTGGSNYLIKNGPDTLSGAISLTNVITASGAGDIIVNSIPLGMTSAVNKAYADGKLDMTTGGTVAGVVSLDSSLKIKNAGAGTYVTINGGAGTANYSLAMPSTAGTSGYVLQTDGAGNLSWNNPNSSITAASTLTTGSITTNLQSGVVVNPYGAAAGNTGEIRLKELAANGTTYVALKAPDLLAASVTYTLPIADGTSGQVLTTNAAGTMSWTTVATGGTTLVGDIGGTIGANTIGVGKVTSAHILDGTILNADINAAAAIDYSKLNVPALAIPLTALNATGTKDATKYLKGDDTWAIFASDVWATVLTGLSTATSSVITAADSVLISFGKLQAQITTLTALDSNKLSKNTADSITAIITVSGAGDIILPTPAGITSAVNKTYVDTAITNNGVWNKSGSTVNYTAGNVGIGTTTPGFLLDVNGNTRVGDYLINDNESYFGKGSILVSGGAVTDTGV
ncbi:MAG: hypothetical protein PHY93_18210, partial [Bacteriovorax sp.]|nr:hypothetical protein [Bacteriovorax sp.]